MVLVGGFKYQTMHTFEAVRLVYCCSLEAVHCNAPLLVAHSELWYLLLF